MPEGEERGDSFEDLFEDLDRFFAPADPAERRRRQAQGQPGAAGAGPEGAAPSGEEDAGAAEGDDLLPPGWEPDLGGLELPAEPQEEPVAIEAAPPGEPPAPEEPVEPGSLEPGSLEPGPIEPGPIEPEPVDPVEPEPIEPEPSEPEPLEPFPPQSPYAEAATPEPRAHRPDMPGTDGEEAASDRGPSGPRPEGEPIGPEWTRLRDVLG